MDKTGAPRRRGAVALLAQLPLFRHTPRPLLANLAAHAVVARYPAGDFVVHRGESVPGLMLVRYGLVKLVLTSDPERILRLAGARETFGEAALFLDRPLPVDAIAVVQTELLVVPAAPLLALLDGDRGFARSVIASVCHRLQAMVADFESATAHPARERLAAYLVSLGGERTRLPAPKAVIAARLGITRETLSRLLREFMDQGLIAVVNRDIRLLDRGRLAKAARGEAA